MMGDLTETVIAKSDQLNADDLVGGPITINVRDVTVKKGDDQPCSIFYDGDNGKPYKPSKGMRRLLMMAWKTDDSQTFIGRSMTLWRNPDVLWAGKPEGGIRISHLSHIDAPAQFAVTVRRGIRERVNVEPLRIVEKNDDTAARNALANATTLDELRTTWSAKAMAPFRDCLAGYLEQRKSELTPLEQGSTDEQHGDQFDGNSENEVCDELEQSYEQPMWKQHYDKTIAAVLAAQSMADVKAAETDFVNNRVTYDDEAIAEIGREIASAKKRLV